VSPAQPRRAESTGDAGAWLVVGLGNPGDEYSGHRHNVGFMTADRLASAVSGSFRRHKRARALVIEARLVDQRVVLAKPTTYMNDSGQAVAALRDFYGVDAEHLVVVHDELDLPFARLRLKLGGGDNGHNGLKSIRRSLGTGEFHRVRIGIGRPPGQLDPAAFVLRNFGSAERTELPLIIGSSADATVALITRGLAAAQQEFNG
jgi:PTH1 family peptidyl-tRNA hydrolase